MNSGTKRKLAAISTVTPAERALLRARHQPIAQMPAANANWISAIVSTLAAWVWPAPPQNFRIGVMDVGQGGCNLVFGPDFAFYFDVGKSIGWNRSSDPPGGISPCIDARIACIILSHWDPDHWHLAYFPAAGVPPAIAQRTWIVPNQQVGTATYSFIQRLQGHGISVRRLPVGHAHQLRPGVTIHVARTAPGPFVDLNITGFAVAVVTGTAHGQETYAILPGDGGLSEFTIPPLVRNHTRAIGAPHHGGWNNDFVRPPPPPPALPVPVANALPAIGGNGSIAYSFGIKQPSGVHCYGHPLQVFTTGYHQLGWVNRADTAAHPRGHVLLGENVAVDLNLPCTCPCDFRVFPGAKRLNAQ